MTVEPDAITSPRSNRDARPTRGGGLWPDAEHAQRAWAIEAAVRAGAMPDDLPRVASAVYAFINAGEVPESPPA